jgi:hypothetical protein
MVVTAASAAATTAVTTSGGRALLGGLTLALLMTSLIGQEIFSFGGTGRFKHVQRALSVAAVPLAFAVAVVLVVHIGSAL